jgi:hypothetical protein
LRTVRKTRKTLETGAGSSPVGVVKFILLQKGFTMTIDQIKNHADARKFLVDLVGNRTTREIDKLVGYSGWSAYKNGKCEIAAGTWFKIYNAVKDA